MTINIKVKSERRKKRKKERREGRGEGSARRAKGGELTLRRFFDNLNSLIIVWMLLCHIKKGGKK
jgi:hypothetical protein